MAEEGLRCTTVGGEGGVDFLVVVTMDRTPPSSSAEADDDHSFPYRLQESTSPEGSSKAVRGLTLVKTITGDGQLCGSFKGPNGIAFDGSTGTIYVSDTYNHRVLELDGETGRVVRTLHGARQPGMVWGSRISSFNHPIGMAVDAKRFRLVVADSGHQRIVVLDTRDAKLLLEFGTKELKRPIGVTVEPVEGHIVVCDKEKRQVMMFNGDTGEFMRYIHNGMHATNGDLGAHFEPMWVAIDVRTNSYLVSNTMSNQIAVFHAEGTYLRSIGLKPKSSLPQEEDKSRDWFWPSGIAVTARGQAIFSAFAKRVVVFDIAEGQEGEDKFVETFASPSFQRPYGLCVDPEQQRVWVIDYSGDCVHMLTW